LSSRGLQWFTRKSLGYLVEAQNRGRGLDEEVRPPKPVQLPRRGSQTAWAGLTAHGGGVATRVTATDKVRSGGHASGSQALC
jgi:hypothetical protein